MHLNKTRHIKKTVIISEKYSRMQLMSYENHDIKRWQKFLDLMVVRQRALEYAGDGIIITESVENDCPIVFCNEAFVQLTGNAKEDILGKNCRFLQGEDTNKEQKKKIRDSLENAKPFAGRILNYRKNGTSFWNHLTITPIFNPNKLLTHFIGIQRNVTELHGLEKELKISGRKNIAYKKAVENLYKRIQEQEGIIEELGSQFKST